MLVQVPLRGLEQWLLIDLLRALERALLQGLEQALLRAVSTDLEFPRITGLEFPTLVERSEVNG